jgi:hypothetical protein
MDFVQDG